MSYEYQLGSSAKILSNLEREHESLLKLQKRVMDSVGVDLTNLPPEAIEAHLGEFHI